jgi:hypothetical protein
VRKMAVTQTAVGDTLIVILNDGSSTKTLRYSNVKADAIDDNVKAVADAIVGVQAKNVMMVERQKTVELEGTPA